MALSDTKPTIAVVAAGAMGAAIGARLVEGGAHVLTSTAGRSRATQDRAAAAGMNAVADDALVRADMILSIVPPNEARGLATRVAACCRRLGTRPLYLDLNAISPATARDVEAALRTADVAIVDGAIIGAPPKPGTAGPVVYLSGETGEAQAVLRGLGLDARTVDGGIGAASALKLSYAAITKGLTALCTASLLAAQEAGVDDALLAELGASQSAILTYLRRAIPDMLPKAYRWDPEMREIEQFLGARDAGSAIYDGAAALYRTVAQDVNGSGEKAAMLRKLVELPRDH